MKKYLRNLVLLLLFVLSFLGCDNDEVIVFTTSAITESTVDDELQINTLLESAAEHISILNAENITEDFSLPSEVDDILISWECNSPAILVVGPAVIFVDGVYIYSVGVNRPSDADITVLMTGTFAYGGYEYEKEFNVRVKAEIGLTTYSSISEALLAADLSDLIQVTGFVYAVFQSGYFIIDASGGCLAIATMGANLAPIQLGDEVTLKGTYESEDSRPQISSLTKQTINSSHNHIEVEKDILTEAAALLAVDFTDKTMYGKIFTLVVTPKIEMREDINEMVLYSGETKIATVSTQSPTVSILVLSSFLHQSIEIDILYYAHAESGQIEALFLGTSLNIEPV